VWTFGDGGSSYERNPKHTYNSPLTYTVTLAVSNAGGSDQTFTTYTVNAPAVTKYGSISVTSDPVGAEIWLDGVRKGVQVTPDTLTQVPIGFHIVEVRLPPPSLYYNTASSPVEVENGKTASVSIKMDKKQVANFDVSEAVAGLSKDKLGNELTGKFIAARETTGDCTPGNPVVTQPTVKVWNNEVLTFTKCECGYVMSATNPNTVANFESPVCYACSDNKGKIYEEQCTFSPALAGQGFVAARGTPPNPGERTSAFDPPAWTPKCNQNCDKYYALLISGGIDPLNNEKRYWNDIDFMYKTLK
jgi:PKD repeat protein